MKKNKKIILSHSGQQYSYQTARALQRANMLSVYFCGHPSTSEHVKYIKNLIDLEKLHYKDLGKEGMRTIWNPLNTILRKASRKLLSPRYSPILGYEAEYMYDIWASKQLHKYDFDAVIAYENASLKTFQKAKEMGKTTILDAASVHYLTQDVVGVFSESKEYHRKVIARKAEEIRLADYVFTLSDLAKQSYVDAGVPKEKILSTVLGFDHEIFYLREEEINSEEAFKFVFVGTVTVRKGIDHLIKSFKEILKVESNCILEIIGPPSDGVDLISRENCPNIQWKGALSQKNIAEKFKKSDCLVLPSRHDSFGMVVVEGMACGVPVILSDMVGAKEVVKEGQNGWVFPLDHPEELTGRMKWCVENKNLCRSMRKEVSLSVKNYTWEDYYRNLQQKLLGIL